MARVKEFKDGGAGNVGLSMLFKVINITQRKTKQPWMGSSLDQSVVPICQGYGFGLQSGYVQEATNECINKWNNKSMLLPLFLALLKNQLKKVTF